jgi:hypothetical protein
VPLRAQWLRLVGMGSVPKLAGGFDPVIERYKSHIDRTLLRENLKLTPEQRLRKLAAFLVSLSALRTAGRPK